MRLLTFVSSADQSPHFELVVTLKPVGGLRRVSVCVFLCMCVCVAGFYKRSSGRKLESILSQIIRGAAVANRDRVSTLSFTTEQSLLFYIYIYIFNILPLLFNFLSDIRDQTCARHSVDLCPTHHLICLDQMMDTFFCVEMKKKKKRR